ncbi:glycoside hydrolase [Trichodelitschia bisporula]|uniref:xylan 1,4-beta-xylosidase n=1 Tax=Trichodelitschia bisporula TaxID=703511 RepID=A0A6G1HNL3_9PEZI|nr:glycoside hydrolase [Trichodelitschia bisporula]
MSVVTIVVLLSLTSWALSSCPDCEKGPIASTPICDPSFSGVETLQQRYQLANVLNPFDRATTVLERLNLTEKVALMGHASPGVPRLGLHGVASGHGVKFASSGDFSHATSFPQPILLGATVDDDLIRQISTVISTEARAFSNADRAGLDLWTPNINPFEDPRWGRSQETPGEDPFHISSYVRALVAGLEGDRLSGYKRVITTCMHFAAYDPRNGTALHATASTQRSLSRTWWNANVGAVLCSYNAVNGVPTCASDYLLNAVLRGHWAWASDQHCLIGDCGAVENVFKPHQYAKTPEEAVAWSLNAGTDLDCGHHYQKYLASAYEKGMFGEATLDRALARQFSLLFRVGYFDHVRNQALRALGGKDVNTPKAQELALRAVVEGITLLKNNGVLPLSLGGKSIALIGSYAGTAPYLRSPLEAARNFNITVHYAKGISGKLNSVAEAPKAVNQAVAKSDVIILVSGINNGIEGEEKDRTDIAWSKAQLALIARLSSGGKPLIVVQMDGGPEILNILTGHSAPAGRLPVTQYPAAYVQQLPMTDMSLRPSGSSPGRTYKWYTGTPVFEFGLHYTNFTAHIPPEALLPSYSIPTLGTGCRVASGVRFYDRCAFARIPITIHNTGTTLSDYVLLGFLSSDLGLQPQPRRALVAHKRLRLGSLARVDGEGNTVLWLGEYVVSVDMGALWEGRAAYLDRYSALCSGLRSWL